MSVFDHCSGPDDVWTTLYAVACLCHPDQGGTREDLAALCRDARRVVDWPEGWPAEPKLFDMFCKVTGTDPHATPSPPCAEPLGYAPPTPGASLIDWGRVELVAKSLLGS